MRTVRVAAAVGLAGALIWGCKDFVTNPSGTAVRAARQLQLDSAQFQVVDGDTLRLKATVLDQHDSAFATLPVGVALAWSSSAPAVATVDTGGLVKGIGPGQAQITATVTTDAGSFGASAVATVIQPVARLVVVSGGAQADTIGATLAESLVVQAQDSAGRGVPAVALAFTARGGTVSAPAVTTDASGLAAVAWTLPSAVGTDTVRVTTALLSDSVALFVAHARPGAPASVAVVSGDNQGGTVGTPLAAPLVVRVADRLGDSVPGAAVAWAAGAGGGSLAPDAPTTGTTGQAQAAWTLGTAAGAQSATASAAGVATPATFTASAAAAAPATVAASAGNNQTAAAGTAVAVAPAVLVKDAYGNPVAGVTVTFAVISGGGSVTGGTPTTGANGVATVGSWKLGTTAGLDSLTATASGNGIAGNPVRFGATARAGAPASIAVSAGNSQTATVGTAVPIPPAVIVKDADGNAVPGVTVTFAVLSGGGSVSGGTQTTGANGIATVGSWTLGPTAGLDSLTATASGSGITGNPVRFGATASAGAPASIGVSAGNNQTAATGTAVPIAPAVIVKDGSGNPVAGVSVTFAIASGGGSVAGASQTTGANGVATVGGWTLGATPGSNTLTATAAGSGISGNPVTFTATGTSVVTALTRTWVGGDAAGPTDWSDANNWSPAGAPGASDTALIPSTASSPVLTANTSVAQVRMTGDSLTLNGHKLTVGDSLTMPGNSPGVVIMRNAADSLLVGGNVTWGRGDETGKLTAGVLVVGGDFTQPAGTGTSFVGTGAFKTVLTGAQAQTVSLYYAGGNLAHFQDLELDGTAPLTLSGRVPVTGSVSVLGARAVTGNDTLYVAGNLTTAAGSGLTLAGLEVGGALSVAGSYAVGVTNFTGSGQVVPAASYTNVVVTGGPATLGARATASGSVTVPSNALTLGGHTLEVGTALTVSGGGTLVMTSAQDSAVVHGNATFGGSDETGKLTAGVLVVDGSFIQPGAPSGNAFVASGTHKTVLTGVRNDTISFTYGYNSHFQDLELPGTYTVTMIGRIPVAGNFTMGQGTVSGRDSLIVTGNVTASSGSCEFYMGGVTVYGSFTMQCYYQVGVTTFAGTNQVIPSGVQNYDTLVVSGSGATTDGAPQALQVRGALYVRTGAGSLSLRNPVSVQRKIWVHDGTLTLGGQVVTGQDSLTVDGSGVVVMTNPADTLSVSSDVTWGGGDETGKLAAGVLEVGRNFTQPGAQSGSSFAASGTFKTVLQPYQQHTVFLTYAGGGSSHFQDVEVGAGARVYLAGRIPVFGAFHMIDRDTVVGNDTLLVSGSIDLDTDSTFLSLPGVAVGGTLNVKGIFGAGVTNFTGTNQVIPTVPVVYDTLEVTGPGAVTQDTVVPVSASGALLVRGNGTLTLQGIVSVSKNATISAGSVTLNGHFLVLQDSLTVTGTGVVVMTNAADSLVVFRTATFGGGDETGKITAGHIAVLENFVAPGAGSATAFVASGSNTVALYGSAPQTLNMYYGATAHFQNLDLSGAALGVTLLSDVAVQGVLTDTATAVVFGMTGNARALTVGGVNVTREIFDHVLLTINGPAITAFNNVTFQNYATADNQLSVATTGTFSFSGLTFATTPTTGHYVSANAVGGPLGLTIGSNLSPAAAAALTQLLNGATVTWM